MDPMNLARLVAEMRAAQREYFRTRSDTAKRTAMHLEGKVDRALRDVLEQPSLLPGLADNPNS